MKNTEYNPKLYFNTFASVIAAYLGPQTQKERMLDWSELIDKLSTSTFAVNKKDPKLFNLTQFKEVDFTPPKDKKTGKVLFHDMAARCKENVAAIDALMLDIDGKLSIEQAKEQFKEYAYILYTTHSHKIEAFNEVHGRMWNHGKDKFRIILKLTRPMPAEDFLKRQAGLCSLFGIADKASFTVSQCFYFPSHHAQNRNDRVFYVNEGRGFYWQGIAEDPDYEPSKVYDPSLNKDDPKWNGPVYSADEVFQALSSCSNVHYVSDDAKNGSLSFTAICRGFELNEFQFMQAAKNIAASDSNAMTSDHVLKQLRRNSSAIDRCSNKRLEAFLAEHNATYNPKTKIRVDADKYKNRLIELKAKKNNIKSASTLNSPAGISLNELKTQLLEAKKSLTPNKKYKPYDSEDILIKLKENLKEKYNANQR